jgi:16S rRNA processing protein RimM
LHEVRETKSVIIATIEAESDDEIASARGAEVVVARTDRFEVPEGEYYVDDLIGLVVRDKEGTVIGRLSEVWETPANDIYRVLDDKGREILLPAIEDVILSVDIERGELMADISTLT